MVVFILSVVEWSRKPHVEASIYSPDR